MTRATANQPNQTVQQMVERIARSQRITRQEYLHLVMVLLADSGLHDVKSRQINYVFDAIRLGEVAIGDW